MYKGNLTFLQSLKFQLNHLKMLLAFKHILKKTSFKPLELYYWVVEASNVGLLFFELNFLISDKEANLRFLSNHFHW